MERGKDKGKRKKEKGMERGKDGEGERWRIFFVKLLKFNEIWRFTVNF